MKKRDIIIIALVLAIGLGGMAVVQMMGSKAAGTARIYVGDTLLDEVSLDKDQIIEIDQGSGVVNHVEVKDGAIFMADSTCPDKQCVYQGAMSADTYEQRALFNWIVCLPNRIVVELQLEGEG